MLTTQALPHSNGPISRVRTGDVRLSFGIEEIRSNHPAVCADYLVADHAGMADQWNATTPKFGPSYHSQRWRFAT